MEITTAMIKELRDKTGAGILDCRKALQDNDGDFEAAMTQLREKGLADLADRSDRKATEGVLEVYSHTGQRVGVMLEMNCETDFVARTPEFQELAHELVLHIAFAAPDYLTRDEVPAEVIEAEKEIYRAQALEEGKPEHILDRIVEGKLEKFYAGICLMEQPFVKDEDRTIADLFEDVAARMGEKMLIRRFVRYELGEELD